MGDIQTTQKGGKAGYLKMGIWYDEKTEQIHLTLPDSDWFHTTVNAKEGSKRCHQNLYGKLARALRDAGLPAPTADE